MVKLTNQGRNLIKMWQKFGDDNDNETMNLGEPTALTVLQQHRPSPQPFALNRKSPIQKSSNENNELKYGRDTPIFAKNAENRALTALSSSPPQAGGIITY